LIEGALTFGFSGTEPRGNREHLANVVTECLDRNFPLAKSFGVNLNVCPTRLPGVPGTLPSTQPSKVPGLPDAFQPRC
jgi:hypothetical protein